MQTVYTSRQCTDLVLINYHSTENPYSAAQRFLENHELPLTYLDEVVKFIEKNVSGVNISGGNSQYVDPFTGALLCLRSQGIS